VVGGEHKGVEGGVEDFFEVCGAQGLAPQVDLGVPRQCPLGDNRMDRRPSFRRGNPGDAISFR